MTTLVPETPTASRAAVLRADPSRVDRVFDRLHERVASGDIPAAALAIGDGDGEIRSASYGGTQPLTADSNFFLASVTKPIFATAFMQLVERGSIGLHDPIQRVLPEFAGEPAKSKVTAWHLLTHTSGVPDIGPDEIRRTRPSAVQMTRSTLWAPLRYQPGTRWEYCSASFYLLGEMILRVTGVPYVRYLRENVLDPLGMHATFDPRRGGRPVAAVHGVGADNRVIRFLLLRYMAGAAVPGGGLFGTLDDLLRFGAATLAPRVEGDRHFPLKPETIAEMQRDHLHGQVSGVTEGEERPMHFGLGWGKPTLMRELPGSSGVASHGGATGTRLWIDPDAGLVLVFFTNTWNPDRGPEIEAIDGVYSAMKD
ncbi:MAG: serine hydrolase domain-containing protein [Candidatus Limnocylindrales bacterium]